MRGLWVLISYIFVSPIALIGASLVCGWVIIKDIIDNRNVDFDTIKEYFGAMWEGVKQGHKVNKLFVEYGNDCIGHLGEL